MRASCLEWNESLSFCLEKQKGDPTGEDHGKAKVIPFQIQGTVPFPRDNEMLSIVLKCAFLSKFVFFVVFKCVFNINL